MGCTVTGTRTSTRFVAGTRREKGTGRATGGGRGGGEGEGIRSETGEGTRRDTETR